MRLYDVRVSVERIEGRSVCGLQVGDYFEVTESNRLRIPEGKHFCMYALQSVLPLIPAKQRRLPAEDWLEQDNLVCCPDPDERVVMRIERVAERTLVPIADAFERVRVGPAALNPLTLRPVELAGQAAAIDVASDGRAYLGLVAGAWLDRLGLDESRPVARMRVAVEVVRRPLADDRS